MHVGIFSNKYRDVDYSVTKKVMQLLSSYGIDFSVHKDIHELHPKIFDDKCLIEGMDAVLTIGGDGTILRIVEFCAKNCIPIVGINMGKVGFLTEAEASDIENLIKKLLNNDYNLENRIMLEILCHNKTLYALNEAVVLRNSNSRMVSLDVFVDGQFVDNYYCDGFIVSSPTGSTAYFLSAGGPIINPCANVLGLMPINSHSLHSRPIIIGCESQVEIKLNSSGGNAVVCNDGSEAHVLSPHETVIVKQSNISATFAKLNSKSFYSKLLSKLNTWSFTPNEGDE